MKWISVKKSTPNTPREVLCMDAIGDYFLGYYIERVGWMVSMYDEPDKSNEYTPDVTHWCEIKPPKRGFFSRILRRKRKIRNRTKKSSVFMTIEEYKAQPFKDDCNCAEMAERTLSSEIEPLSEETAQQLADAIEAANKATQEFYDLLPEFTDNIIRRVEEEMAVKILIAAERFANASFLTRWYWKRKVEKLRTALEETHKGFEEWRGKYANH